MLDFDISKLEHVDAKIGEVRGKKSIFHLEWLSVYLEIREALLTEDLEDLFRTKLQGLQTQVEILQAHEREGIADMSHIALEFAQRKFVELYSFLHTQYREQLLIQLRGPAGTLYEDPSPQEAAELDRKVGEREEQAIVLLQQAFEAAKSSPTEIAAFLQRNFFAEDLDPQTYGEILDKTDEGLRDKVKEFFEEEQQVFPAMVAKLKERLLKGQSLEELAPPKAQSAPAKDILPVKSEDSQLAKEAPPLPENPPAPDEPAPTPFREDQPPTPEDQPPAQANPPVVQEEQPADQENQQDGQEIPDAKATSE